MSKSGHFDAPFRDAFVDLLRWRRDVRSFERDPLPPGTLERLIGIASLAPSVGLSQPWRFVTVDDPARRDAVQSCFERCNADALTGYSGERAALYARLKLEGLKQAPCQFAVFADCATRQGHGLGRQTMPATLEYSAVMAVYTLWLAARAEGIGLGWLSILDPTEIAALLEVSADWKMVGYFCLGYPSDISDVPKLEAAGWETRSAPLIVKR